jgi:hypothetical protein
MLTIQHFNKSTGSMNTKALHKFMGSIAFVAGPRVAFAIMEDPDNPARRLFLHAKNNIAPTPAWASLSDRASRAHGPRPQGIARRVGGGINLHDGR